MDKVKLLEDYRARVIELREIQMKLARAENVEMEIAAKYKQAALNELWPLVLEMLSRIDNPTTYMIVHYYFVLGQTAETIAGMMFISPSVVQRRKALFLETLREEAGK